jgi:flagellar biogenesis protein FliO
MKAFCVWLTDEEGYDPDAQAPTTETPRNTGQSANQISDTNTTVNPDSDEPIDSGFSFVHLLFMILFVAIVCCVVIWLRWVVMRFRETRRMTAQVRIEAQNIEQSAVSQESRQSQP